MAVALVAGPIFPTAIWLGSYVLLSRLVGEPIASLAYPLGFGALVGGWLTCGAFLWGMFRGGATKSKRGLWIGSAWLTLLGVVLLTPLSLSVGVWGAIGEASFPGERLVSSVSSRYFLKAGRVAYSQAGTCMSSCEAVVGADPDSFRPIGERFAVDIRKVYCEALPLREEKPENFRVLAGDYARGSQGIYFGCERLPADADSFTTTAFTFESNPLHFGRDSKDIYCKNRRIAASSAHFVPLQFEGYYGDDTDVYQMVDCTPLRVERSTFEFVLYLDGTPTGDARDAHKVVSFFTDISKADPATFRYPCAGENKGVYAMDSQHVYHLHRAIQGAHPLSFAWPSDCHP